MSNKQKVFKSGRYSLALIIPVAFRKALGLKSGDAVRVKADEEKQTLTYSFSSPPRQLTLLKQKSHGKKS